VSDGDLPDPVPGIVLCGSRLDVPRRGDYPHCQLPEGHDSWHRWVHSLDGVFGEVEYRWA
jgi:hypothetical protein